MYYEFPEGLNYTSTHEWIKIEGDMVIVGITDHAQELLTDIVFVELPEVGKQAEQNKQLGVIESVKSASDVYAPISGEVIEANKELSENPVLINEDAFGKGWIAKIKVKDPEELKKLMSAEEYDEFIKESK